MDARRLGMGAGPAAGLPGSRRAGVPDRRRVGRPRRGLAGTGPGLHRRPVQGRPRAADPHPPPPGQPRRPQLAGTSPASMAAAAGPLYRLADYLDQHGRAHRASQIPPAEFWSAAAAHAAPGDQAALGDAAHARGLYRDAAQLHKNAAASGNPRAALYLSRPPACLRADPRPAHWAAAHVALDDPRGVAGLLDSLRAAGAHEQAAALLARDPAAHAALDNPGGVACLLDSLREAGADEQAAALLARDPAAHASLDNPAAVARLLAACGRRARTSRPPRWPAAPPPTSPSTTRTPWPACWTACGRRARDEQAAALLARDPPPTPPSTTRTAWPPAGQPAGGGRARAGRRAGRPRRRPRPPRQPGRRGRAAGQPAGGGRGRAGRRAAGPRPPPTSPSTTRPPWPAAGQPAGGGRARAGRRAGWPRPPPTPPSTTRTAWPGCWTACGRRARTSRPPRWPAGPPPTPPSTTRAAWPGCWTACGRRARTSRPPRWPAATAAHVSLDNPGAVARLLDGLREAGADEQAAALLAAIRRPRPPRQPGRRGPPAGQPAGGGRGRAGRRAAGPRPAAHAPLDNPAGVASLLDSLREAGAHEQAAALLARDPAAHAPLDDPRRPWPACWTACGRRARTSRPPRWQAGCRRQACSGSSSSRKASRISSVSDGRPTAPRPRHGAGKTWTYGLFPDRGDREATLPVGLPPTRRIRKVSLDSSLSGRPELHCEAQLSAPAPRSLHSDRTSKAGPFLRASKGGTAASRTAL